MEEQADRLARGEWYLDDGELQRRRRDCWIQLDSFNSARAEDDATRARVLLALMGSMGERALVMPRFQCSYGSNISIGPDAFVNANVFFMDDALITIGEHARVGPRGTTHDGTSPGRRTSTPTRRLGASNAHHDR